MIGLTFEVAVDILEVVPQAHNVLNDYDATTIPLGLDRHLGEKSKDYLAHAHFIAAHLHRNPLELQSVVASELRQKVQSVFIDLRQSDVLAKVEVSNDHKLKISTYALPPDIASNTELFIQEDYEYDLLDRNNYPFLDELIARVNADIPEIYMYMSPHRPGRSNHLLPCHLYPTQLNYQRSSSAVPSTGTSFYLEDRYIIPDSISFSVVSIPDTLTLKRVAFANDIVNPGDFHIDYITGKVTMGSDLGRYSMGFNYRIAQRQAHLKAMPALSVLNLADVDVLARLSHYDRGLSLTYNKMRSNILQNSNGYIYNDATISPRLDNIISNNDLGLANKRRWS